MSIFIEEICFSKTERIRISVISFRGIEYVLIQLHVKDSNGKWIRTNRALSLNFDQIEEYRKLVEEGRRKLIAQKQKKVSVA